MRASYPNGATNPLSVHALAQMSAGAIRALPYLKHQAAGEGESDAGAHLYSLCLTHFKNIDCCHTGMEGQTHIEFVPRHSLKFLYGEAPL